MITLEEVKYHIPFFVILVGVLAFWLSIKMDTEASTTISIPIEYEIPHGFLLDEESPSSVSVNVSGKVYSLLNATTGKGISINLKPQGQQKITAEAVQEAIANLVPENVKINSIPVSTFDVYLYTARTKKVPISTSNIDITLNQFYNQISPISFEPDSVEVSGPRGLIEDIKEWPTEKKSYKELSDDISNETLKLVIPENEDVSLSFSETQVNITIDRLIEDMVLCEVPRLTESVIALPSHIEIKYSYAKRKINTAACADFEIDLNKIDSTDRKYNIEVISKDALINVMSFYPTAVEILSAQD